MAVIGMSAKGVRVDFDMLAIRQQLASRPIAVGVNERRTFIDTKDGIKPKEIVQPVQNALVMMPAAETSDLAEMLAVSTSAATESTKTKK